MVMKKRSRSLKLIFLEYLFTMAAALAVSFLVPFLIDMAVVNTGFFSYANSGEAAAKSVESIISSSDKFDSSLVPPSTTYAYLSTNFTVLKSNMNNAELENAINVAKGEYNSSSIDDCYLTIKRKDGTCILHYYVRSQYRDKWLNGRLPSPDQIMEILIILNGLFSIFICSTLFAKRLNKELKPLLNATQKISEQDLDFEVQSSGIKEFNHILAAISEMKSQLKSSLEQQWHMEQTKKEQTSALAHDIKTPLTIIRGNAELLRDSKIPQEQQEYTEYILKNTDRMEQYLKMLIDLTRADAGYSANLQKIPTEDFVNELMAQTKGLALAKQLDVELISKKLSKMFIADPILLERAIMNVVSNSADFCPEYGKIIISVETSENHIHFCVTDNGKGFSQEDLEHATSQFYMGDKSRSAKVHFGIGLYIVETIVKLHHGVLHLANSPETGGGQVTIEIPII